MTPGAMVITRIALSARSLHGQRQSSDTTLAGRVRRLADLAIEGRHASGDHQPAIAVDRVVVDHGQGGQSQHVEGTTRLMSITVRNVSSGSTPRLPITRPGVATPAQLTATRRGPSSVAAATAACT